MKLSLNAQGFVEAINWVTKNFDMKDDKAFIALHVDKDGNGYLTHENVTSFMKAPFSVGAVDLDGKDSFKLALDGRYIQRLAGALGNIKGEITLSKDSANEKSTLDVKGAGSRFTVPTFDSRISSEPTVKEIGDVNNVEYFDALQRLAKLCDVKNAGFMPVLETIDLQLDNEEKTITLMATDRYSLGEIIMEFTPRSSAAEFIENNPHLFLTHQSAILVSPSKNLNEQLTLVTEEKSGKFGYSFTDGKLALFSLKSLEPLLYGHLKTSSIEKVTNSFDLVVSDFKKAMGVVSSLAWEETDIYLEISKEGLVVSDSTGNNTMKVDVTELETDGDYRIKIVREIINSSLNPIATPEMRFHFSDQKGAIVLRSLLDNGKVNDNVFALAVPSQN